MSKPSSPNRKNTEPAGEGRPKWLISVLIGASALIVILAIVYFAWPKTGPTAELKIEDLVVGTGREVKAGDTLHVEYTSWLQAKYEANQPFDVPRFHDKPFEFVLGRREVIAGWDQGLLGMKVGGKRRLFVPADMAYGAEGGADGRIPPNAPLVFEIEVLDAQGPPAATLPSSSVTELKIEDLVVGSGKEAKAGDTLSMNYTGWLENGTKFDSSLDSGQPIEFVLGQGRVIAGWEQGLVGMKVGGKRRLTIPPDLGYGIYGAGDIIPANATLIFEVELMAIK